MNQQKRMALGIEYDGGAYAGWQWQKDRKTVQETLELALSQVAAEPVRVVCAGRTDAGVHALEQVVHFDTAVSRDLKAWVMGTNANLPRDIRVLWAREMSPDFHARTSAIARFYRYIIWNRPVQSALKRHLVTWSYYPLDEALMQAGADFLIGDHDFTSFRAQGCQSRSPNRFMHFIRVQRRGDEISIDIAANAFLHHMVRNIVGTLMAVGRGEFSPEWVDGVLAARDRTRAGITAPAEGLYLGGVFYPEQFGLQRHAAFEHLPKDARRYQDRPKHETTVSL